MLRTTTLLICVNCILAWGSSSNGETSIYGNSLSREWLEDSSVISIKLEGCMWGYVSDNEDAGCMEDESEDGTTYWYQMANCRRAQAVFSMYGSSGSSSSCSSSDFKESFVTMKGLDTFIEYLAQYDANSPFGDNYNGDEGDDDQAAYDGDFDDLPMCEQSDNGYVGLGCADDGTFSLVYYEDAYCLQPSGSTYDSLSNLNKVLKTYRNCAGIWYNGNDASLPYYLVSMSDSCSSLDSGYCSDNSAMRDMTSHTGSHLNLGNSFKGKSWVTKLKYVTGGLLLLASFVMFTGILFTNRRRRRALLQRKYRNSKKKRSKSKSRSKSRSRSRAKSSSRRRDSEGVFA